MEGVLIVSLLGEMRRPCGSKGGQDAKVALEVDCAREETQLGLCVWRSARCLRTAHGRDFMMPNVHRQEDEDVVCLPLLLLP